MCFIVEDLYGCISGKVYFYGKFKVFNIEGNLMMDVFLKIGILNILFIVIDIICLFISGISFDNICIVDMEGY